MNDPRFTRRQALTTLAMPAAGLIGCVAPSTPLPPDAPRRLLFSQRYEGPPQPFDAMLVVLRRDVSFELRYSDGRPSEPQPALTAAARAMMAELARAWRSRWFEPGQLRGAVLMNPPHAEDAPALRRRWPCRLNTQLWGFSRRSSGEPTAQIEFTLAGIGGDYDRMIWKAAAVVPLIAARLPAVADRLTDLAVEALRKDRLL